MTKKKSATDETPNFESALTELETLVEELEDGDLDLATSLQKFERGVTLARQCQAALSEAEQKVQILSKSTNELDSDS